MNMSTRRIWLSFLTAVFSAVVLILGVSAGADEVYGPVNLLKTMRTPFGGGSDSGDSTQSVLEPLKVQPQGGNTLAGRLLAPRLYLPGRMTLGSTAEFIIKGRPGYWAALAMADKNSGAKPVYGHVLHLGPDRKLVSLGQIPDSGVLSLVIDTPIEGDLIGEMWYFEAAIWSTPDFSDLELATPVVSESTAIRQYSNGVVVSAEPDHKRGIRIVPDSAVQLRQVRGATSLDSGRP